MNINAPLRTRRMAGFIGFVSSLALLIGVAAPAHADSTTPNVISDADYDSWAQELIANNPNVAYVGRDGGGQVIVSVSDDALTAMAADGADALSDLENFANVTIEYDVAAFESMALTDAVGGAGIGVTADGYSFNLCSFGFAALTADNKPAMLTAGHCGNAGDAVDRSDPSKHGTADPLDEDWFGTMEFSVFGEYDIAGVVLENPALTVRPFVTDWKTAASKDLSLSGTRITQVAKPTVGQAISKSGRTTGLTTSSVTQVDVYAEVDGVGVRGFISRGAGGSVVKGDSGGAVFAGNVALGIVSGGTADGSVLLSTELVTALQQPAAQGYRVMLDDSITPTPVYRFWSPISGSHFYTASTSERDHIVKTWPKQWKYEGEKFRAFDAKLPGTTEVYRFWSNRFQAHFYTADPAEKAFVEQNWSATWTYEKVAFYAYPESYTGENVNSMYRFWGLKSNSHFYTTDQAERDHVSTNWSAAWQYEGPRFKVPK